MAGPALEPAGPWLARFVIGFHRFVPRALALLPTEPFIQRRDEPKTSRHAPTRYGIAAASRGVRATGVDVETCIDR